jgi:hypothetical protein
MLVSLCFAAILSQPQEVNAFYIGHSLSSDIPDMVMAIAGSGFKFRHQDIPGAPLRWQWEEATRKSEFEPQFQGRYHTHLTKDFNALVMVDSVPRGEEPSLMESIDYAGRFLTFARTKNPQIRTFYYEPWHHTTSGTPKRSEYDKSSPSRELTWRPRITADRPKWDRVVAEVNKQHPGAVPMKLIPAATGLGQLSDAIAEGKVPGLKKIEDLFSDDIHLNPLGKYFVACIHYRALFGGKVSGRAWDVKGRWGGAYYDTKDWAGNIYPKPSAATAKAIQAVADQVVIP